MLHILFIETSQSPLFIFLSHCSPLFCSRYSKITEKNGIMWKIDSKLAALFKKTAILEIQ